MEGFFGDTDITIRRATRADIPAIVHLLADDPLGQKRERDEDPLPSVYFDAFERIDADPRNRLVVVEALGEVVGTLQLTFLPYLTHQGGTRVQIEAVRVDRRYRGRGMGQVLFEWAIEQARQAGCRMVQLTTNAEREDAHVRAMLETRPASRAKYMPFLGYTNLGSPEIDPRSGTDHANRAAA